jgi:hypothetical protein
MASISRDSISLRDKLFLYRSTVRVKMTADCIVGVATESSDVESTMPYRSGGSLVDEMHIAVSPRLLGTGEPLFAGLDLPRLGYRSIRCTPGEKAVFYVIARG